VDGLPSIRSLIRRFTKSATLARQRIPGSDASIYRKYRFDIDISIYRIVSYRPRKYRNFRYTGIDFLIYHLPNFHVWCQAVVKFSLKLSLKLSLSVSESFNESFNENFTTSWHHTWKFGKRITYFFIVRKFREILHYYLLVRISKAVISRKGPCLSSIC